MLLLPTDPCIASGFYTDSSDCLYDISYNAPASSGFGTYVRADFSISNTQNLDQQLVLVDQLDPQIIAGPYLKNITDTSVVIEWQTDEPVTTVTQVIGGASVANDELLTQHSVVLTGLTADTHDWYI